MIVVVREVLVKRKPGSGLVGVCVPYDEQILLSLRLRKQLYFNVSLLTSKMQLNNNKDKYYHINLVASLDN